MNDGVALCSTAHPRSPWYKWLWFQLWTRWRAPTLSLESLEPVEIDWDAARESCKEAALLNGLLDNARSRQTMQNYYNQHWARKYAQRANMSDTEIEKEIQAKGLTAPRVTLEHIESVIAYELYTTGDQAFARTTSALGPGHLTIAQSHITPLRCLTLCVLVLKNGFTVTGESSCASPENFDEALGRKIARQKAIDKVWMLEGYALKERLHARASSQPAS